MNIFFNTFYFCSFFLKGRAYWPGRPSGLKFRPAARPTHKRARAGLGPARAWAGPKAGRELFGDP